MRDDDGACARRCGVELTRTSTLATLHTISRILGVGMGTIITGNLYNHRPQEASDARTYVLHDLHAVVVGGDRTAAGCPESTAGAQAVRRIGRRDGHDREGQERPETGTGELRATDRPARTGLTQEERRRRDEPDYRMTLRPVGAVSWPPGGTTKSVMLCGGSVTASPEPATATSGRRAIALAAVNCQARAAPPGTKLAMLI